MDAKISLQSLKRNRIIADIYSFLRGRKKTLPWRNSAETILIKGSILTPAVIRQIGINELRKV